MKKISSIMVLVLIHSTFAFTQIKAPIRTKTTVQQNATIEQYQTTVPVTKTAKNLVNQTNSIVANSLSTTYNMPDGNVLHIQLKRNPGNIPQNFGGKVTETVLGRTEGSSADMDCVTEIKTVNAQSSSFMNVNYSQSSINLYPGAIYSFNDFVTGNFRAVDQKRNPITIRTDNLSNTNGPVFLEIPTPNADYISQAINKIVEPFSASTGSSNLQFRVFQSENDAEMAIKLSAGGGYAGFKASGGFSFKENARTFYLTVDAIKPMYTITTSIPANGYFSDPAILTNNPQLITIQSVTYGTRILANVEINITSKEDVANFNASFGKEGVSANANLAFEYLKNAKSVNSTVNGFVVGGPMQTSLFNKDNLLEEITTLLAQCNYRSAKPIAYSFADMNGNLMGIETATDKFPVVTCTPKGSSYELSGVTVQIMTTEKKEQGSNVAIDLFNSNNNLLYENSRNNTEFSSNNTIVLNRQNISPQFFSESGFSNSGGYVDIFFEPKQFGLVWDEWQINQVTITLNFKDKNGLPKPGETVIQYSTKVNFKKDLQRLRLPFNSNYQAGTPFLVGI